MNSISKIMGLNINVLGDQFEAVKKHIAVEQHTALEKHAINVLHGVIKDIREGNYEAHSIPIGLSPAAYGYGTENEFIDFGYGDIELDISGLLSKLQELKNTAESE